MAEPAKKNQRTVFLIFKNVPNTKKWASLTDSTPLLKNPSGLTKA